MPFSCVVNANSTMHIQTSKNVRLVVQLRMPQNANIALSQNIPHSTSKLVKASQLVQRKMLQNADITLLGWLKQTPELKANNLPE